jgi:hypothetical protein
MENWESLDRRLATVRFFVLMGITVFFITVLILNHLGVWHCDCHTY